MHQNIFHMYNTNFSFIIQFNFLESRIMKHAKAFAVSGIYEEPVDPTVASQVIYPLIRYLFFIYCQYIRHLIFVL